VTRHTCTMAWGAPGLNKDSTAHDELPHEHAVRVDIACLVQAAVAADLGRGVERRAAVDAARVHLVSLRRGRQACWLLGDCLRD
jgi:hypothetical protein